MSTRSITVQINAHSIYDYASQIDSTVTMRDIESFIDLYESGLTDAAKTAVTKTLIDGIESWLNKRLVDQRTPKELRDNDDEVQ